MASKKSLIGAAGLAAALGLGGAVGAAFGSPGISGAQTEDGTETTAPATTEDGTAHRPMGEELPVAAELLGMTEDELATALQGGSTIAGLAEERGVDVQDIIDALVADTEDEHVDRITAFVNGEGPIGGPGGHGPGRRMEGLEAAATALGTTVEDLRTQLQDGATIASIAEANGVDVQTVIDAMVADASAEIDEAVAAGRIDADRAAEIKAELPDRVTDAVNGELHGPGGFDGPGGHGGFPGGPPDAPADAPTDDGGS